jgi:hypothetical protein
MSDRPDFSKLRVSGADEWKLLAEAYAETYPVRPLMNHVAELAALLMHIVPYVETQTNVLEECSTNAAGEWDQDDSTAEDEVAECRRWIVEARAALAKAGLQ